MRVRTQKPTGKLYRELTDILFAGADTDMIVPSVPWAVRGDIGCTSFEDKEAQSKAHFEEKLRNVHDKKWASRVHFYGWLKSVDTH